MRSELGGNFESLIVGLITPPTDYLARQLNKAMKGAGTDSNAVSEILVTRSNEELKELGVAYERSKPYETISFCLRFLRHKNKTLLLTYLLVYNRPLVEHLCSETSGDFRKLLTLIVTVSYYPKIIFIK